MTCYRDGGCGPYEMYSCNECPASKPEFLKKKLHMKTDAGLKARAIESAKARVKRAKEYLASSTGNTKTLEKKQRTVEIAEYILEAVKAYERG